MILTGDGIRQAMTLGDIEITPFDPLAVGPNTYDWHLGAEIWTGPRQLDAAQPGEFVHENIPPEGMVLTPGCLYLGHTLERTGSNRYAQLLNGSRSTGSLGIWVHVSAPLGHVGHAITWTLEIQVVKPVRIYSGMPFGKLLFLETRGRDVSYQDVPAKYKQSSGIESSRLFEELP